MNNNESFQIIAKTSFGLEDVLIEELKALGVKEWEKGNRTVTFSGNKEQLYKANLWLRTASRLILPFKEFDIESNDELYQKIKDIDWESLFDVHQTFAIDSTIFSPLYNNTKYAALKAKDAIADRFRAKFDKRPNVDIGHPDLRIHLHISAENRCTLSLDSSGDPLFKRGYKDSMSPAPIKENLAAGLILLSGWDKQSNFIDLMCGSGTLLIEGALIAYNIPPNLNRSIFGFMNWKTYDKPLFDRIVQEASNKKVDFNFKIIGVDFDNRVLGMCRTNIAAAGLTDKIELHKKDFVDFEAPQLKGIIISNPPYGERMGEKVDALYKAFGDNLKKRYDGWNGWLISSNIKALKQVGLRPSKKIKLFNGNLECRFMKYEMYRGTKKNVEKDAPQK